MFGRYDRVRSELMGRAARVPVLSEAITVAAPSVSTECNSLTPTFQRCLRNAQRGRGEQPGVGTHGVAFAERQDVAPTSSLDGTVRSAPSRSTVDDAAVIDCNAATAVSALLSCTRPRMPFSTTMAAMTSASIGRPVAPSATQTTIEMATATSRR